MEDGHGRRALARDGRASCRGSEQRQQFPLIAEPRTRELPTVAMVVPSFAVCMTAALIQRTTVREGCNRAC
jgi:hypothetical protein